MARLSCICDETRHYSTITLVMLRQLPAKLTLRQLAEETGVTIRSLRYYIGRGWLPQPESAGTDGYVGRPPGVLPAETLDKVRLIREQLRGDAGAVATAKPIGTYTYIDGGRMVEVEVIQRTEDGDYLMLRLRNGDTVLRKKA